jgi:hypothetical protein
MFDSPQPQTKAERRKAIIAAIGDTKPAGVAAAEENLRALRTERPILDARLTLATGRDRSENRFARSEEARRLGLELQELEAKINDARLQLAEHRAAWQPVFHRALVPTRDDSIAAIDRALDAIDQAMATLTAIDRLAQGNGLDVQLYRAGRARILDRIIGAR